MYVTNHLKPLHVLPAHLVVRCVQDLVLLLDNFINLFNHIVNFSVLNPAPHVPLEL